MTMLMLAGMLATPSLDPTTTLVQYGVLGVVVLGFIMGWITPGPVTKAINEENKRLTALIENKIMPMSETYAATLEKTAGVMDKTTVALEKAIEMQARLAEQQRDQSRAQGEQ